MGLTSASRPLFTTLLVLTIAACAGPTPTPIPASSPWTKDVSETTCTDWLTVMDDGQRAQMASTWLALLEQANDPAAGPPTESSIDAFASEIGNVCGSSFVTDPNQELAGEVSEYLSLVRSFRP